MSLTLSLFQHCKGKKQQFRNAERPVGNSQKLIALAEWLAVRSNKVLLQICIQAMLTDPRHTTQCFWKDRADWRVFDFFLVKVLQYHTFLNSEPLSRTPIHKHPSEEYSINTLTNSKEFWNVSILLLYLMGVSVGLGLMPPKTQQEAPHLFMNACHILLRCSITQVPTTHSSWLFCSILS